MPNIPIYSVSPEQARVNVSDRAETAFREQAREVGTLGREGLRAQQEGARQFEQGFHEMGQTLQQHADFQDRMTGVRTLADLKLSNTQELKNINGTSSPDELPQKLAQFNDQFSDRLDQWQSQFVGSSRQTQLWAQERVGEYKLEQSRTLAADSAINAGNKAVFDIGHIANSIAARLTADPSTISSGLSSWDQAIQGAVTNPALNTPQLRGHLQQKMEADRSQFVETGIYKAIDANPVLAEGLVKQFGDYLTPQQQRAILEHSTQTTNKQFWQNRAEQEDARRIEKDGAQRALTDLTTSTFALGQDGTVSGERFIPPNYFSKLVEIANMPGADHTTIRAANEDAKEILNRQKNGVVATTDQATYQQLFGKAYNGLTDQDIFSAHAQGKLSDHDSTMFHQTVTDAARNPQMTENKRQFEQFINTFGKSMIMKSNLMNPSAWEGQRLQQFENDTWQVFQQGITKGIPVHDLLDQRNPNFVGKGVERYQLSPDQQIQGITDKATGGLKPLAPVAPSVPRMPGESATDYLKRSGPGGP